MPRPGKPLQLVVGPRREFKVQTEVQLVVKDERGRARLYLFKGAEFSFGLDGEAALALDAFEQVGQVLAAMRPRVRFQVSAAGGSRDLPLQLVAVGEPSDEEPELVDETPAAETPPAPPTDDGA